MKNQNSQINKVEQKRVIVSSQHYCGPIPSPEVMDYYKSIDSSFPDRILKMAEEDLKHQHEYKNRVLKLQGRDNLLGLCSAFTITITIVILGSVLLYKGKDVQGFITLLVSAIPAIITYFINKK
ncbi:DUF2335 domain-containing protein [Campylobacter fetus]|uniref:DUF2335 domain-containing protein n=1 Tax=Campylobacter fetus subsp. testudinum TaxID=1507806 RepID=A0AAX0HDB0_CAMFE|nr:DUF2335 domain-containing protein [Campylobacter fetus]OCR91514.1 hypothetical protein CFT12S02225_00165 [Campylobacter fetus subsp. testudinum]OCR93269.1 hypothetical protein CFT12S02263_01375 [Campylobacter fetus subsp. testudinum]